MFEQLERIFRAMNRARNLGEMVATAMRGLEIVIPGARARVASLSYDVAARLKRAGLERKFVLETGEHSLFARALDLGRTLISGEGLDAERRQCCVVPFDGGVLYLDAQQPFTSEHSAIAGLIAQQLQTHLSRSSEGLMRTDKDALDELPNAAWLNNQLHLHESFSLIALEIDGYDALRERAGAFAIDHLLRELAVFLTQQLQTEERLARCRDGEFLILSKRTTKAEMTELWQSAMHKFENLERAARHKVTLSAGISVCPDDGNKFEIMGLAQSALARAGRVGRRVVVVAAPPLLDGTEESEPRSRFDARSAAVVRQAVCACQAARRHVDPLAVLDAFFVDEGKLAVILTNCGLEQKLLGARLKEGEQSRVEFTEKTQAVFAMAMEFAHRGGRRSVGIEELFLACLADSDNEGALRECGLQYGLFLAEVYRAGIFHQGATFLLGNLRRPEPRRAVMRFLPVKPVTAIAAGFGHNFSSELWGLLARAREEAKKARNYLDFAHLYIALLESDGASEEAELARKALEMLGLEIAPLDTCHPTERLIDFLHHVGARREEVTIDCVVEPLRDRYEIKELERLMEEFDR